MSAQTCQSTGSTYWRYRIFKRDGAARYFEYLMARAQAAGLPFQDTLVPTRPYLHKLWRSMPIADRLEFNVKYGLVGRHGVIHCRTKSYPNWRLPPKMDAYTFIKELSHHRSRKKTSYSKLPPVSASILGILSMALEVRIDFQPLNHLYYGNS